jgi:L-ascorbate metabolism protein UlaG (beta-lactamase superfamily)
MATSRQKSRRKPIRITWLGHSAFRFDSPEGKVVLIDPWLDNPKAPPDAKQIEKIDAILVTHGHSDHVGNTVELAARTDAMVVAIYEVANHLRKLGVSRLSDINKSGKVKIGGISVTMVDAKHSSGIDGEGIALAGADPAGYVVEFENGQKVYHAGDTGAFMDMKLIAELYRPEIVILPIGGYYTMGPREAAKACSMLKPKVIIGMHYGTFPLLAGTPQELKKYLPAAQRKKVLVMEPGVAQEVG